MLELYSVFLIFKKTNKHKTNNNNTTTLCLLKLEALCVFPPFFCLKLKHSSFSHCLEDSSSTLGFKHHFEFQTLKSTFFYTASQDLFLNKSQNLIPPSVSFIYSSDHTTVSNPASLDGFYRASNSSIHHALSFPCIFRKPQTKTT